MEKKEILWWIIILGTIISVALLVGYGLREDIKIQECMRDIANDFCKLKEETYHGINFANDEFSCIDNERKKNIYQITEEERKGCKK